MWLYIWSRTVSHGLSRYVRLLIRLYTDMAVFIKVLKTIHGLMNALKWPKCNLDKATVGWVVCTVYTDGQPYKPCVLC